MGLTILISILVLGGLGAAFGAMLGAASKKFAVEKDERVEAVRELLPGANCGGCGFPGCDGLAAAIADGKAEITACAPLSAENAKQIGEVMGVSVGDVQPKVARVMCLGSNGNVKDKFVYDGAMDCRAAYATASGFKACRFACLGLGTCAKVCKFDAITMGKDGIAAIDEEKCTGCGRCVEQCPQSSIAVLERNIDVYAGCTNRDKGKAVTVNCAAGCIGCGICAKVCPFDAIAMEGNLPVVDYDKCRRCWLCVEKCPRHCILTTQPDRKAIIDEDKCIGCTLCKKACEFEAVEGELKQKHKINENCRGCGLCVEKCRKDAIRIVEVDGQGNVMEPAVKMEAQEAVEEPDVEPVESAKAADAEKTGAAPVVAQAAKKLGEKLKGLKDSVAAKIEQKGEAEAKAKEEAEAKAKAEAKVKAEAEAKEEAEAKAKAEAEAKAKAESEAKAKEEAEAKAKAEAEAKAKEEAEAKAKAEAEAKAKKEAEAKAKAEAEAKAKKEAEAKAKAEAEAKAKEEAEAKAKAESEAKAKEEAKAKAEAEAKAKEEAEAKAKAEAEAKAKEEAEAKAKAEAEAKAKEEAEAKAKKETEAKAKAEAKKEGAAKAKTSGTKPAPKQGARKPAAKAQGAKKPPAKGTGARKTQTTAGKQPDKKN